MPVHFYWRQVIVVQSVYDGVQMAYALDERPPPTMVYVC